MPPEVKPQPGPQHKFHASPADVVVYGGAAGGGKTWSLLVEPLRHVGKPRFGCTIFRRTYPEVTNQGGPWDESMQLYPQLGGVPRVGELSWTFPGGARVEFGHLQYDDTCHRWHGSQIPLIEFDELTLFTEYQFTYLLSRNRSTCGVRPYIRATCNPDAGSWVADWVRWWVDPDTGYPIPERSGVVRWFCRDGDRLLWAGEPDAQLWQDKDGDATERPARAIPKSFTFIPARLEDNPALTTADPGYLANLMALPEVERERLHGGNWKVVPRKGEWPPEYFFGDVWFDFWPTSGIVARAIGVDPSKSRDSRHGDYRAIVEMMLTDDGTLWVDADLAKTPAEQVAIDIIERQRQFQAEAIVIEVNQFLELFHLDLTKEAAKARVLCPTVPVQNSVAKSVRIRRLGPYLMERRVKFKRTPGARLLVTQLGQFPDADCHDDGPDAMEMALRGIAKLTGGAA